jgi:hypothetical protein
VFRHHQQPPDLEKTREIALTFETLVEMAVVDPSIVEEEEKRRFLEELQKIWGLVPCSMAGSFAAKMNLLLISGRPQT